MTDIVYLDFPKAFDNVPHPRFLKELNCHGIGRIVLTWINTWLKDRKQAMNIRLQSSEWRKITTSGITQQPVLGSMLTFASDPEKWKQIATTNLVVAANC